ncbi:MAG: tRNA (adenosine(37)-N6)-threonylcarbamoyltransferase complex dimerization subunit type 1 TsaB [Proteobacteria bacterium]|nr:tRNA (adenosine(37)-N6)-threonylcarbamoyltransferase complex dimerization subunit type 1 TsaB [Pseudomonadota bacterium]
MKLLALDTSSIACTVALQLGNNIFARHEEQPREHTKLLMPMIRSVLEESGVELNDLEAIVLGNGPGSFIGMRIATSVAQGLAFASGLRIVPVSSMAAVAAEVFANHDAAVAVVTQDAHMHEVYLGIYERGPENLPEPVCPERLHGVEPIAELDSAASPVAAGFGWQRYPDLLANNRDRLNGVVEVLYPRARYLLALGTARYRNAMALEPQDVVPAYLRQKVAEKPVASP